MTTMNKDEREERLKQIRRWRMMHVSANSDPYADLSRAFSEIDFLLSLYDSQADDDAKGASVTGVTADIVSREGVLDGWHEEVVMITPDERDDLGREWRALQGQIDQFRRQFELLDDPQGLYSETRSKLQSDAATRMRDLCVAKVRRVLVDHDKGTNGEHCGDFMTCDCGAAFDKAEFITALESLTLDSVQKDSEGKNDGK